MKMDRALAKKRRLAQFTNEHFEDGKEGPEDEIQTNRKTDGNRA